MPEKVDILGNLRSPVEQSANVAGTETGLLSPFGSRKYWMTGTITKYTRPSSTQAAAYGALDNVRAIITGCAEEGDRNGLSECGRLESHDVSTAWYMNTALRLRSSGAGCGSWHMKVSISDARLCVSTHSTSLPIRIPTVLEEAAQHRLLAAFQKASRISFSSFVERIPIWVV